MDPGVAAALITAASVVIVAFLSFLTVFLTRRIGAVHDEVRTNNGKRAGEYIEEGAKQSEVVTAGMAALATEFTHALAAHTSQDTENFEQLRQMLKDQNAQAAANK